MKWINALSIGMLAISACSDPMDPVSFQPGERRAAGWVGRYSCALDTVVLDRTETSVQAQLDLYRSPACQFHAEFSTQEPDDWAIFHSESCLYYVERGAVILTLKMRVHFPGGNELVETSATFEPVDEYWTAVVWTNPRIRLDREVASKK